MKIIIAGGREFDDMSRLRREADLWITELVGIVDEPIIICSGGASGADRMGELYAHEKGYDCEIFAANWTLLGKRAGPERNRRMADYADALLAFWDGKSRGTKNMIEEAMKRCLPTRTILYKREDWRK